MASANQKKKEQVVSDFKEKIQSAGAVVVTGCTAIEVGDMTEFRAKLRTQKVELRVVKNTLAKRAISGTGLEGLTDSLVGQTAIAITNDDPVAMAKSLKEFADAHKTFDLKSGALKGKILDAAAVNVLASVPSREVLLGRMVGSLQSPYAGMVYCLSGILRKTVYALDAIRRKKEEQGA